MPPVLKATLGFLLTLAAAWVWHAPLGHGERLIERLQRDAEKGVEKSELPGITVRVSREPLARTATLSGPADALQREGLGSQKGVSDYVRDVDGMADVRWKDEPGAGRRSVPLLVETWALAALAYLIGLGLGWLIWGRRRREGFL
jgi:hypothetical protein